MLAVPYLRHPCSMEEMKEAQMLEAVGIAHSIVCEVLEMTDAALRTSHSQEAGRNGMLNCVTN